MDFVLQTFGYMEEEKGYYAGFVASAMFVGRIFGRYVRVFIHVFETKIPTCVTKQSTKCQKIKGHKNVSQTSLDNYIVSVYA